MIGRTVSHYRIESQLGAGGMGVVYRAEDVRLGRAVALKFLPEDLANDADAIRRLRAEARSASALNHPGICTIYDIGEIDAHPFIVMELLKGRALRELLGNGPLKVHQLVDIGIEIADALQAAHGEGIIHRDITPGNIFVTDRGHVKVLDFGLAKLAKAAAEPTTTTDAAHRTAQGVTLGTVAYMSPEQATGEELDGRTDLFSLGAVLYECATGRHPFPGKTSPVILAAILNRIPVAPAALNPELPLRLQEVINNCLEKDRELRYQSAGDLRADLRRVRRDLESGQSRAVTVATPTEPPGTRPVTPRGGTPSATTAVDSSASPAARSSGLLAIWIAMSALVLVIGFIGPYLLRRERPAAPVESSGAAVAETIRNRLALATASLDAKNYRAAVAYASEVLAIDPNQPAAIKIRDEATASLARADAPAATAAETPRQPPAEEPRRSAGPVEKADRRPPLPERSTPPAAGRSAAVRETPAPQPTPPPAVSPVGVPTLPPPPPAARSAEPAVVPPATPPAAAPATQAPPPAVAPAPPRASQPQAEEDDAAIRRVAASYARAIETKDLTLFRSIKPNLSREEERRLQEGFRAVSSQRVALTILSIDRRGDEATVRVKRRDTIEVGGRMQTIDSDQTLQMTRASAGWVVSAIR